jgi:hypothetical protein
MLGGARGNHLAQAVELLLQNLHPGAALADGELHNGWIRFRFTPSSTAMRRLP